jgi:hypothetical protein
VPVGGVVDEEEPPPPQLVKSMMAIVTAKNEDNLPKYLPMKLLFRRPKLVKIRIS